ncbi:hypothetical protein BGW38_006256 [Lunasporangiospora selenospora]|uniref:Uncharacterized protein n=1 Tax=Lunasporangiospora selenospora TaxID=979761 RepID=A0A9P6FM21_9FUNG|nr:hypothetical protein BGW38_006256 [Lunasporangiospora selenospora]
MRILCLAPPALSRPIGSWARRPSMPRSLLPAPLQHVGSFQSTAFFHHDQAYTTATHRAAADDNNTETTEALHDRGREPDPGTLTLLEQKRIRPYFYFIDIHGQLFLQDTRPKNLTSCFKDLRFLDFFYTRLRANTTPYFPEYAWQSPCGKEINFVEAADTPVVFHSFHNGKLL